MIVIGGPFTYHPDYHTDQLRNGCQRQDITHETDTPGMNNTSDDSRRLLYAIAIVFWLSLSLPCVAAFIWFVHFIWRLT